MDSLTTAYLVSMLIGSVSAIASALVGNKVFPIESSAVAPKVESITSPVLSQQNIVKTEPEVSSTVQ